MENGINNNIDGLETNSLKNEFLRYLNFWPYFIVSLVTLLILAIIYLRYTPYQYKTSATMEIIDKAQDSEMALPTAMTIFNRSMIRLDNEIGVLNSYTLHERVSSSLKSNVTYFNLGKVKDTQVHGSKWFSDYDIKFNIDTDTISNESAYIIQTYEENSFSIEVYVEDEFIKSYDFFENTTNSIQNDLPFELTINDFEPGLVKKILFSSFEVKINHFQKNVVVSKIGDDSDQLEISYIFSNPEISEEYINRLIFEFDNDGIKDRELEYSRTITFVDSRSKFISSELEIIENQKLEFKKNNNLSDLKADASINIKERYAYDGELFATKAQRDLSVLLKNSILETKYEYLPVDIGIDNLSVNEVVFQYNQLVKERNSFMISAGVNNPLVINLEKELDNLFNNIIISIDNYQLSLDTTIKSLSEKENEFSSVFNNLPNNEKVLRSINRELEVKESLFLLLLQKREEAAINLAVIKPSIKIIDRARTLNIPSSPNLKVILISAALTAFLIPFVILYFIFQFDTKIHTKSQLKNLLDDDIPIISEIPYIFDQQLLKSLSISHSRSVLSESIRMLISNLKFTTPSFTIKDNCSTILFTSSIKGEGKTLASVTTAYNLANDLSKDKKVILLGTDLRNPQVHKNFGVEKDIKGVSEIVYNNDYPNFKKYIKRFDNLDVLFSGAIPPNPTALLASDVFSNLISNLKKNYDYIIIDSAPCLLVSDTFQYVHHADSIVYLLRSNFTDNSIVEFINEIHRSKKISNLNIVFNAVGNSSSYGYKYGYQYGYKYGYKYAYNYGYGYGYGNEED